MVGIKIFILHLQFKKIAQYLVAFLLTEFVDFDGVPRIGIQYFFSIDRVGQESRVSGWWAFAFFFFTQSRAGATRTAAHHVPKLIEIMRDSGIGESFFQRLRDIVVHGAGIAKLSGT